MAKVSRSLLGAAIAAAMTLAAAHCDAAIVSGVYTSPGGAPLADRQLHFENRISGDIYLARTGADGSFTSDLPPGTYDLRAERGLVVKSGVVIDGAAVDMNIGRIHEGAPLDVRRPFEREGVGPSIVATGAPGTAHLDNAPVPAAPVPAAAPPAPSNSTPTGSGPLSSLPQ
jgi:hypothetical protein